MFNTVTLWIPFTVTAALGQVARNAMQRSLTGPLGTWGATNIRFLFGFPFSVIFFGLVIAATGDAIPWPTAAFWPWLMLGALSQIVATGLMLLAMNDRSFVVTTAYLKTEAIQTAIFGFVFLGDHLTTLKVIAILIATIGVIVTALRPGGSGERGQRGGTECAERKTGSLWRGRWWMIGASTEECSVFAPDTGIWHASVAGWDDAPATRAHAQRRGLHGRKLMRRVRRVHTVPRALFCRSCRSP